MSSANSTWQNLQNDIIKLYSTKMTAYNFCLLFLGGGGGGYFYFLKKLVREAYIKCSVF